MSYCRGGRRTGISDLVRRILIIDKMSSLLESRDLGSNACYTHASDQSSVSGRSVCHNTDFDGRKSRGTIRIYSRSGPTSLRRLARFRHPSSTSINNKRGKTSQPGHFTTATRERLADHSPLFRGVWSDRDFCYC